MTHFIAIFALLQWSASEPTVSPRYAYTSVTSPCHVTYSTGMTTRGEGNWEILPTTYILHNDLVYTRINETKIKMLAPTQHPDAFNIF